MTLSAVGGGRNHLGPASPPYPCRRRRPPLRPHRPTATFFVRVVRVVRASAPRAVRLRRRGDGGRRRVASPRGFGRAPSRPPGGLACGADPPCPARRRGVGGPFPDSLRKPSTACLLSAPDAAPPPGGSRRRRGSSRLRRRGAAPRAGHRGRVPGAPPRPSRRRPARPAGPPPRRAAAARAGRPRAARTAAPSRALSPRGGRRSPPPGRPAVVPPRARPPADARRLPRPAAPRVAPSVRPRHGAGAGRTSVDCGLWMWDVLMWT